jgi:hypothetical protein
LEPVRFADGEELLADLRENGGKGLIRHPIDYPSPGDAASPDQAEGTAPGSWPVAMGTRTALPHSVHEPS